MGEDILFDCDLRSDGTRADGADDSDPPVSRVI
jgi:hypothetical protein